MAWTEVKAADLRVGDRLRVTLEGAVISVVDKYREVRWDGTSPSNSMYLGALDAGKLEREERPLAVGDRVRHRSGTCWEIAAPPRQTPAAPEAEVCVWNDATGYAVLSLKNVERIPPQAERVA